MGAELSAVIRRAQKVRKRLAVAKTATRWILPRSSRKGTTGGPSCHAICIGEAQRQISRPRKVRNGLTILNLTSCCVPIRKSTLANPGILPCHCLLCSKPIPRPHASPRGLATPACHSNCSHAQLLAMRSCLLSPALTYAIQLCV